MYKVNTKLHAINYDGSLQNECAWKNDDESGKHFIAAVNKTIFTFFCGIVNGNQKSGKRRTFASKREN